MSIEIVAVRVCVCAGIHATENEVAKNFAAPSAATCHCESNLSKALYHAGQLAPAGDSRWKIQLVTNHIKRQGVTVVMGGGGYG